MADSALLRRLVLVWCLLFLFPLALAGGRVVIWGHDQAAEAMLRKIDAVLLSKKQVVEAALRIGVPLDRVRGADKEFQSILRDDPSVRAVALADAAGKIQLAVGLPVAAIAALFDRPAATGDDRPSVALHPGGVAVSSIALEGGNGNDGSLVIISSTSGLYARLLLASGGLVAVAATMLIMGLGLVWYGHRLIWQRPLAAVEALLVSGAAGRFEATPLLGAGDEIFQLEQRVRACGIAVEERIRSIWEIAAEVRSVTPEPEIASDVGYLMAQARLTIGPELVDSALAQGRPTSVPSSTGPGLSFRRRLLGFVAAALLVEAAVSVLVTYRLEGLIEHAADQHFANILSTDLRAGLERVGARMELEMTSVIGEDTQLLSAIAQHDRSTVGMEFGMALDSLGPRPAVHNAELFDQEGQLLRQSAMGPNGDDQLLSPYTALTLLRTGQVLKGLTLGAQRHLLVVRAIPLEWQGARIAVAAASSPADNLLADLSGTLQAGLFIVDPSGALLFGDRDAWHALGGAVRLTNGGIGRMTVGDKTLIIVSNGIADLRGGRLGYVVAVRDVTSETLIDRAGFEILIGPVLLAALLVLGVALLYLRNLFGPLNDAVAALRTLAAGETMVLLKVPPRDDEVGRIARSVHVFRETAIALQRVEAERARRRRRQERVIRRQMIKLAETLEADARASVLNDLAQMETHEAPGADTATAAEFDTLVVAFRQMTDRVSEQHNQLSLMVEQLRESLKTKTALMTLQQELSIAAELQASILPKNFPVRADVQLYALMKPAKEVGGDFYDVFEWEDGRVGVVVADVSGKGVPAALFMAIARTLLKATALFVDSPAKCLGRLNDLLAQDNEKMLFVTTFYGILDPASGRFTYANGGHNPPFIVSRDGAVTALPLTDGIALAVMPEFDYREESILLIPGDALVMYTDGVTEAESPTEEQYGEHRLVERLTRLGELSAQHMADRIVEDVHAFAATAPQADDITCLVLRYRAGGAA